METAATTPSGPGTLQSLGVVNATFCKSLASTATPGGVQKPRLLNILKTKLQAQDGPSQRASLVWLIAGRRGRLASPPAPCGAPSPRRPDARKSGLTSLDGLSSCLKLSIVRADGRANLQNVSDIGGAPGLGRLHITGTPVTAGRRSARACDASTRTARA